MMHPVCMAMVLEAQPEQAVGEYHFQSFAVKKEAPESIVGAGQGKEKTSYSGSVLLSSRTFRWDQEQQGIHSSFSHAHANP